MSHRKLERLTDPLAVAVRDAGLSRLSTTLGKAYGLPASSILGEHMEKIDRDRRAVLGSSLFNAAEPPAGFELLYTGKGVLGGISADQLGRPSMGGILENAFGGEFTSGVLGSAVQGFEQSIGDLRNAILGTSRPAPPELSTIASAKGELQDLVSSLLKGSAFPQRSFLTEQLGISQRRILDGLGFGQLPASDLARAGQLARLTGSLAAQIADNWYPFGQALDEAGFSAQGFVDFDVSAVVDKEEGPFDKLTALLAFVLTQFVENSRDEMGTMGVVKLMGLIGVFLAIHQCTAVSVDPPPPLATQAQVETLVKDANLLHDQLGLLVNALARRDALGAAQRAVAAKDAPVRIGPSAKSKAIGRIKVGEVVAVLDSDGSWLKVAHPDPNDGTPEIGWTWARNLDPLVEPRLMAVSNIDK